MPEVEPLEARDRRASAPRGSKSKAWLQAPSWAIVGLVALVAGASMLAILCAAAAVGLATGPLLERSLPKHALPIDLCVRIAFVALGAALLLRDKASARELLTLTAIVLATWIPSVLRYIGARRRRPKAQDA